MSSTGLEGRSFLKMHGLGNDFVVLDARSEALEVSPEAARAIADRHTGVGCDQLVVLQPGGKDADAFMAIWNADGSRSASCGNATRCVGWLLMRDSGRDSAVIDTLAGLTLASKADDGRITVDMGPARLDWHEIPLAAAVDTNHLPLTLETLSDGVGVGMGNPHAVFFVPDIDAVELTRLGPGIEHHPLFPERTNVEVAQVLAFDRLRMRVWERGAGITLACGTGACATLVAAARRGLTGRRADIELELGVLTIEWRPDNHVLMTGPIALSFAGSLDPSLLP
jgi:diaminopimelate epimerase